jgi:hypothetical protein
LLDIRALELVSGAFEAELSQVITQHFVCLGEGLGRRRPAVGDILAHPYGLGALSGEQDGNLWHRW